MQKRKSREGQQESPASAKKSNLTWIHKIYEVLSAPFLKKKNVCLLSFWDSQILLNHKKRAWQRQVWSYHWNRLNEDKDCLLFHGGESFHQVVTAWLQPQETPQRFSWLEASLTASAALQVQCDAGSGANAWRESVIVGRWMYECGRLVWKAGDVPQGFDTETQYLRVCGPLLLVLLTWLQLTEKGHRPCCATVTELLVALESCTSRDIKKLFIYCRRGFKSRKIRLAVS